MYLLVDSGSTKADWVLFDKQISHFFTTNGINPSTQQEEIVLDQIASIARQIDHEPLKTLFYGAGTASESAKKHLENAFKTYFPNAELSIFSDLLAAGRALCKGRKAIICILGTGSHAALCDGHNIIHQLPALGYLLGDEGSGNHLGKEILKLYYYEKLDAELKNKFEKKYPELQSDFIYQLYHNSNPSPLLAKFAEFIIDHKKHPQCSGIIVNCFDQFIRNKLDTYQNHSELPVHLCGSIAFYLHDEFNSCLKKAGFRTGDFVQKPIHQLLEYHRRELYGLRDEP